MSAQPQSKLTPEQYLELDRNAEVRSEYYRGEMFAMSGGSRSHSLLIGNLAALLRPVARHRRCELHTGHLRLRVAPDGLYTYPDLMVACGTPQFAHDRDDTLTNPTLIVEVLSPSTEAHDRGFKLEQYITLDTLQEYVLISQSQPLAEVYRRRPDDWSYTQYRGPSAALRLESLDCDIPLAEIYEDVSFPGATGLPG